ncbi:MAG: aminoglycoside 3'-phosphotransferase [Propionibacteriaceae bacterium]|jgi:kanamycin kinase|nr:aminoglycoside 3'-phosphotransferase [Propionibacteriaceae bacterium]
MKLTPVQINIAEYPAALHPYFDGAKLYDSSCSPNARVYFIDKDTGYFLKIGRVADLGHEYEMTRYFHTKGLAAAVVEYCFDAGQDYLLTEKLKGDDCTTVKYLEQPKRLAELLGEQLSLLHSLDYRDCMSGCAVTNHTEQYLLKAKRNKLTGNFDKSNFPNSFGYASEDEAWAVVEKYGRLLKTDTLLHGDYCLPNVILDDWSFSGFVDLDSGGVGDKHVDLFWGAWTLWFNLKTNKYRNRFLDAYGRDKIDEDLLRVIAAAEVFR